MITSAHQMSAKIKPALWFIFAAQKLMVVEEETSVSIPLIADPKSLGISPISRIYLGTVDGCDCYCAEITENNQVLPKISFYGLRDLFGHLADHLFAIAMKAMHLLEWDKTARYCGGCGSRMTPAKETNARKCPSCGMMVFPRISPAVIVLVEKDGQILLARANRFPAKFYSVLAGFVEPGETLEDTIHREIEEEVGIKVRDIRYFGSQPWPFPDSLMIGFTAKYVSGEIRIDETEIAEAGWFSPEKLPAIPGKVSIARQLIDWFLEKRRLEKGLTAEANP
jgi:NAD+ diphosphatase